MPSLSRRLGLVAVLCCPILFTRCGAAGPPRTVTLQRMVGEGRADAGLGDYSLAIGDRFQVQFPYRPDYNRDVVLRTDGKFSVPLIGTVDALGRTPEDVETEIRTRVAAVSYDPSKPGEKVYRLGVGDRLQIKFKAATTLDDSALVRPDGRISLALVRAVRAEGLTPEELGIELERLYSVHIRNAELVVIVRKYGSERVFVGDAQSRPGEKDLDGATVNVSSLAPRMVYVAGEVRTPGFVNYQPPFTALQSIMAAGGPQRSATLKNVVVLRKHGVGDPTATFLNLKDDVRGAGNNDFALRAFDIVIVPTSGIAKLNQALDQYFYQLVPAARNLNFTFFYNFRDGFTP
jgi:polysaccharide biosynthesis/export protein